MRQGNGEESTGKDIQIAGWWMEQVQFTSHCLAWTQVALLGDCPTVSHFSALRPGFCCRSERRSARLLQGLTLFLFFADTFSDVYPLGH